jgi:hypothetical protein
VATPAVLRKVLRCMPGGSLGGRARLALEQVGVGPDLVAGDHAEGAGGEAEVVMCSRVTVMVAAPSESSASSAFGIV